jgi:hypothetical protein
VLRGFGGIAIALPFLEAMGCNDTKPRAEESLGRTSQALADPARFLVSYIPDGVMLKAWYATGSETSFTLNPSLAPLAPYQKDVIVFDGLNGMGAGHPAGIFGLLSGVDCTGDNTAKGITLDQYLASKLGNQTRLSSLVLGVCTGPFEMSTCSALGANQSIYAERDPPSLFKKIVSGANPGNPTAVQAALARRRSILDGVISDYTALGSRVSAEDKQRLDQHLTYLRNIESKLGTTFAACNTSTPPDLPRFNGYDATTYQATGPAMMDLAVLAFSCDVTRVITVTWNQEGAGGPTTLFSFLNPPVNNEHHELSHQLGQSNADAQLQQIDTWHTEQFAYLIKQLKAIPAGAGKTLLDTCALLHGSGLSNGAQHTTQNLPLVLAGNANGKFKTGRYLQLNGAYSNDLLVSIMNAMGVNEGTFGDPSHCKGPLAALAG